MAFSAKLEVVLRSATLAILFSAIALPYFSPINAQSPPKVAEGLELVPGESNEVLLVFEQAVIAPGMIGGSKEERGRQVFELLLQHAGVTQAATVKTLESWDIPFRSFYLVNAILTWLTPEQVSLLVGFDDLKMVAPNDVFLVEEPETGPSLDMRSVGPEWGIERIRADSVWRLGIRGEGVVVGGADTGYEWYHPAIYRQYRGWSPEGIEHSFNWHDAIHEISPLHGDSTVDEQNNICGLSITEPCDDHGHGTHTIGTIIGLDGDDQIGVAPEARWIGCRNMERGYGSPASYIECFEWFLAPTDTAGLNPDPAKAPHVINNSWSCPPLEGCHPMNFALMETAVANLRAAGVVVVVSAGNSGSAGCGSISTPPAIFSSSFTVGASNFSDTIAGFSSRGPVMVDSSYRIKPDVVAPGVQVRSAYLNDTYRFLNGTSMAGPHVAGAVALMISANPALAGQVDLIEDILRETAVPLETSQVCDSVEPTEFPNNTYGYGRIDALAAVEAAMQLTSVNVPGPVPAELTVFPNPARSAFRVQHHSDLLYRLTLSTLDGRTILELPAYSSGERVSLQGVPDGLYILVLRDMGSGAIVGTSRVAVLGE